MGFWEITVVIVIALLVFGPQKLPEVAREMGKGIHILKKNYTDFKVAITKDILEDDPSSSSKGPSSDSSKGSSSDSSWNKKQS